MIINKGENVSEGSLATDVINNKIALSLINESCQTIKIQGIKKNWNSSHMKILSMQNCIILVDNRDKLQNI